MQDIKYNYYTGGTLPFRAKLYENTKKNHDLHMANMWFVEILENAF
jgi:hypothetical protein